MSEPHESSSPDWHHLYVDESRIERQSSDWLRTDPELLEHTAATNRCFEALHTLLHHASHTNPDELVVLRLGVRLFNDAGAALKCARAGYWQPAFAILRDLMETTWLLDYFRIEPSRIERWRTSDYRMRQREFKGPVVREAVSRGHLSTRHQVYSDYSEEAAHPSPEGFGLISPNNMTNIGPFPDEVRLRAFMREMASIFLDGALTFNAVLSERPAEMLRASVSLIRAAEVWTSKHMVHTHRAMVEALEELAPVIPPAGPLRDAFEGKDRA